MERFDAVKFQRKMREALGEKYIKNRKGFFSQLKEQFGYLRKEKAVVH